jgi:ELWxxDGT repeat protein
VRNLGPGNDWGAPIGLRNIGAVLFFTAFDGTNGRELWVSDGTDPGTVLVEDIRPGAFGSDPRHLTPLGDIVLFTADDGVSGAELWKSDGTAAGTAMVKDIVAE